MAASPNRPYNEKDLVTGVNGSPVWLGAIVSAAGALTTNASTATPFFNTPLSGNTTTPNFPPNLQNTLAGKVLLLQATAAGSVLPLDNTIPITLALQTVLPPLNGTSPGPSLAASERVVVIMAPWHGLLQWLPTSGAGNLLVWELV